MDETIWSRHLLELIVETIADGVLVLSKEGRIIFANRSAEKILGLRRSAIIGRTYNDPIWKITAVDGKPFPEDNLAFSQVLETGKPVYGVELAVERPDAKRIILSINSAPIHDEKGALVNVVTSFTDITEHKRAEEALRDSEELYRTIIEYSNDWIWTLDTRGRFMFFNKRAEEVSGYRLKDWRGKTFPPLIVEEDLPKVIEVFQKTLSGDPQQYEVRVKARDARTIILLVNTAPIYSKGEVVGTVSFGRDMTERKQAEEALRQKDRDIRRAYIDVFSAVTGGRLIIMTPEEIAQGVGEPRTDIHTIGSYEQLAEARSLVKEAVEKNFPALPNLNDIIVAFSEAATNAVKHAGSGRFQVYRKGDIAQIMISDSGPGIDFKSLPKATLLAGFSTKQTLGMGFTIMLEYCDRVRLATEKGNTVIVLEAKAEG